MGIIKDFIEYRKVKKLIAEVENKDEEAEAKKQLDEILKKYPDFREEILNSAKESDQIEDEIIAETLTENIETLVNKPKIDLEERELLKTGVKFMGDIGEDVPDEYLNKVANAAGNSRHIDRKKEIDVIKQITDKEKQQTQVAKILRRIHVRMDSNVAETTLVNEIKELREIVEVSKKISDWERKIVGKKIAFNYLKYGSTKLTALSEIIPINKMFLINMPQIVENEYKDIIKKEKGNAEPGRHKQYDQQRFRLSLLNEMARITAYKYNETGEIIIPQSEQMRKISPEEEEFFIKKINNLTDKILGEDQIISIRGRIRGNLDEIIKLEEVTNMINNLPVEERNEAIKNMKEIIGNKKLGKIYSIIKNVELDKSFEDMNEKDIEDRCKAFKQTLDVRRERKSKEEKAKNTYSEVIDNDEEMYL